VDFVIFFAFRAKIVKENKFTKFFIPHRILF